MKRRLLDFVVCPVCEGDLRVSDDDGSTEIITGKLSCAACLRVFPVIGGVPRLLPDAISLDKRRTAERFGWEWQHFVEMHEEHKEQFLDWIHPLEPSFFEGKAVLDGGCGIGRHVESVAEFGAREVIGIDLGPAVETAQRNVGHRANVHIVQADIFNPPFRRSGPRRDFDFVYSIGVLHHLPEPRAGFGSLLRLVKPGGAIFAWVYGRENNAIVHRFINPIRKSVTSHLPPLPLLWLSWPLAAVLAALARGVYAPTRSSRLGRRLPSSAYIASLAAFSFRQIHGIVFDHLTAPTAFYIEGKEFQSWFQDAGMVDTEFSWRNENSWRGRGQVPVVQTDRSPV